MNNYTGSIVFLLCLITACMANNNNNDEVNQATGVPLEIVGQRIDTCTACKGFYGDTLYPLRLLAESGMNHHLVFFFNELMCIECIGDAFRFLKNNLDMINESNIMIIVGYENIRKPAIILEHNGLKIPFCNIRYESLFERDVSLENPVFLVIDNLGKVVEYFDMNTPDKKRIQICKSFIFPIP